MNLAGLASRGRCSFFSFRYDGENGGENLRGSYDVVINNRRLQYKFTIRRNITVIRGQSATGMTTLVDMIRDCNESGIDSGVTISCDRECVALSGRKWEREIAELRNH